MKALDLDLNEQLVGKLKSIGSDGDVCQEPESGNVEVEIGAELENNDVVVDEIEHEPELDIGAELGNNDVVVDEIEHEEEVDIEDEFNYEDFCGFEGVNEYGNDFLNEFDNEGSEGSDRDTYWGDNSSSSDAEESVIDDYEIELYEGCKIGDDEEELSCREVMNGLDGLDVLDGPSERPIITLGMTFIDRVKLWKAVADYAIINGFGVKIVNNEKKFFLARCQDGCPFRLYAPIDKSGIGYKVSSINHEHKCTRVFKNKLATYKWVADYFKLRVQENPKYPAEEMRKDLERELKLHVTKQKVKRARKIIRTAMEGSYWDEFSKLEAYCNALRVSNPGNDVSVELNPDVSYQRRRVFRRMYVCFFPAKIGWKNGCRPFIGLDGTFLKGLSRGVLLTAVGLDANDSLYPLAIVVVDKETNVSWTWFIEWLQRSLELGDGSKVTLMSDMQKGLTRAVRDVLPEVEHRLCARHVWANWSKHWKGNELKKRFFFCAWSSFIEQFNENLKNIANINKQAARAVMNYPHTAWARAFSTRSLCWSVDNNASESFNYWIDECRYLPIIRMIEGIRRKYMEKWAKSEENVRRWRWDYSPKCMKLFEANQKLAVKCSLHYNGDEGYEIDEGRDRHCVQLREKRCTCRGWDLTGIPCQHAICAMFVAGIDPQTQISKYFHKEAYLASYRTKFDLVKGENHWESYKYLSMLPPPVVSLPGRPQLKRRRTEEPIRRLASFAARRKPNVDHTSANECAAPAPQVEKLSKKGTKVTCSWCRNGGHNRSTWPDAPISEKRRPGRPRKTTTNIQAATPSTQEPNPTVTQAMPQVEGQQGTLRRGPGRPKKTPFTESQTVFNENLSSGMGILVDDSTGRIVYKSSLHSVQVLTDGTSTEPLPRVASPTKNFPLPSRMTNMEHAEVNSSPQREAKGPRRIQFTNEGDGSSTLNKLAIKPPGLMWKGKPAISTSQLLRERDKMIMRKRGSKDKEPVN